MKVGDTVYYEKDCYKICEATIAKIGRSFYYIEGEGLPNFHNKVSLSENKTMSNFSPIKIYLDREKIEIEIKNRVIEEKIKNRVIKLFNNLHKIKDFPIKEKIYILEQLESIEI